MHRILQYPGSKWRIASWIVDKMPSHHSYLEPFFGSGAVFFSKQPSAIETINDLDKDIINLFQCIREDHIKLCSMIEATPYSRQEYDFSFEQVPVEPFERARTFLVQSWQGHGFRNNGYKVGWKNDVHGRESAYALRNWYRLPGWICQIVERLKSAQIECRPALEVIKKFNHSNCLIYIDPPYVLSTRTGTNYKYEMNDAHHEEMLMVLLKHKAYIMLSGYENELYNDMLSKWKRYQINTLAEKGLPRTESLWINYEMQDDLFSLQAEEK